MPTLSNRTKQIQVFNIPCEPGCTGGAGKLCSTVEQRFMVEARDGTRGVKVTEKHLPGSVTFLAGEKKDVPASVAAAPDIKTAIDRGTLRLL
jgi:hypothetical protein